jgi:hypothetical protein
MKLTISQISDLVDAIEPVGFVAQRDHAEWRNNQRLTREYMHKIADQLEFL